MNMSQKGYEFAETCTAHKQGILTVVMFTLRAAVIAKGKGNLKRTTVTGSTLSNEKMYSDENLI